MEIAYLTSKRSTCIRRQHGSVIVKDNRILTTGYNGSASGFKHCTETGCIREKLNIPSGERYESCLHGDTVIKLLNGKYEKIKDLAENGDNIWLYSVNTENGEIVPALGLCPRKTATRSDLLKVHFDNGEYVVVTSDERFLMRDCSYKYANELDVNDSLMPMYYNYGYNKKYEMISNTIKTRTEGKSKNWKYEYKGRTNSIPTHKLVYEFFNGSIEVDGLIHHVDENHLNNEPDNLIALERGEHTRMHYKYLGHEFYKKLGKLGSEKAKETLANNPQLAMKKSEVGRKNMNKLWGDPEFLKRAVERGKESIKIPQMTNSDPEAIKSRMRGKILSGLSIILAKETETINGYNYNKIRKRYIIYKSNMPKLETILKYFKSLDEALELAKTYNHKILGIEELNSPHDVYSVTVPKYENFAVDLGDNSCIFVHNCNSLHSENNAIISAAYSGIQIKDSVLYCTGFPCVMCARAIVNAGITTVYYGGVSPAIYPESKEVLDTCEIEYININLDGE